MSNLLHQITS